MVSKSTHVYKTVSSLDILLDIYTREIDLESKRYNVNTPIVLFFHGGGVVSHDRRLLPPHIPQACLLRGWPLVSADYRLFPQASGLEVLDDIKDAYTFVREKLPGALKIGIGPMKNVIIAGGSAGAFLTYQAGHHVQPRPLALLPYYGNGSSDDVWFQSNKALTDPPISREQIEHFLKESVHTGFTPPHQRFDPDSLLEDLSPNPAWKALDEPEDLPFPRDNLFFYLNQNNRYPIMVKGMDKKFDDPAWKDFPPTIIVHGSEDPLVLLESSEKVVTVLGPTPVKLFVVPGVGHAFDSGLYLGDPGLVVVEEAWKALDGIVEERAKK